MADTIALLHRGRIAQVGDAEVLYTAPASAFVARYLGAVNLVPVWRQGATWVSALGECAGAAPFRHAGVDAVSVRPWQLGIDSGSGNGAAGVSGTIQGVRFMGEYREIRVRMDDASGLRDLTVHVPAMRRVRVGARVRVTLTPVAASGG